jgi:hypothetical protein
MVRVRSESIFVPPLVYVAGWRIKQTMAPRPGIVVFGSLPEPIRDTEVKERCTSPLPCFTFRGGHRHDVAE